MILKNHTKQQDALRRELVISRHSWLFGKNIYSEKEIMNCITVVILKSVGWVFSLILTLPWEFTTLRGKRPLLSTWACFCFPPWPKQDAVTAPQAWFFTMSASPRALSSAGKFTPTIKLLSAPAQSHSRVQLCGHMRCSPPGCSVRGVSQARMEWVAIPFSRETKGH